MFFLLKPTTKIKVKENKFNLVFIQWENCLMRWGTLIPHDPRFSLDITVVFKVWKDGLTTPGQQHNLMAPWWDWGQRPGCLQINHLLVKMKFLFNTIPCYDRWQHTISEWLAKLEQRFTLANIDARKIKFCKVFIAPHISSITGMK